MIRDMHECRKKFALGGNGGSCNKCSWYDVQVLNTGMCELEEVVNKVMEIKVEEVKDERAEKPERTAPRP